MEQNHKPSKNNSIRIGIAQGDYNGISYEMIINTLSDESIGELFTPVLFGSSKLVSYFRKMLKCESFSFASAKNNEITPCKPNLFNISSDEYKVTLGVQSESAAELALRSLNASYDAIKAHAIDSIVCCPISQGLLRNTAPDFKGNSFFFAQKSNAENFFRIYCKDDYKIASVTSNIQLSDVNSHLTASLLCNKIRHLDHILKNDFMISSPRIAVISVNPLNEMGQYIGGDEERIITEAIQTVAYDKIFAYGPYSTSYLFNESEFRLFDAILTIYEQQATTIFAFLNGREGAVYTAGLPFVVTEPYCEADYEKAGKNIVNTQPLRCAMYLAKDLTINRLENYRLRKNSLKFSAMEQAKNEPGM